MVNPKARAGGTRGGDEEITLRYTVHQATRDTY